MGGTCCCLCSDAKPTVGKNGELEGELLLRYKNFALKKYNLTQEDRLELLKVTRLPHNFLHGEKTLTELDLTPIPNVTFIGSNFLRDCSSLKHLQLTPFSKVQTIIGGGFLRGTPLADYKKETVNLIPLMNATEVADKKLREAIEKLRDGSAYEAPDLNFASL